MARIVDNSNQLTAAGWAGDFFNREHMVPGGARVDAAQWQNVTHTITAGAAALAGAEEITVVALTTALPSGTVLDFTGAGKFAKLTAAAAVGATALTVEALDTALDKDDEASYVVTDAAPVTLPSGTLIGRTYTERDAGTAYGPADAGDDEIYLVCFEVYDALTNPDVELYRHGSIVKENFLPGWADVAAGLKTAVRAAYTCVLGVA